MSQANALNEMKYWKPLGRDLVHGFIVTLLPLQVNWRLWPSCCRSWGQTAGVSSSSHRWWRCWTSWRPSSTTGSSPTSGWMKASALRIDRHVPFHIGCLLEASPYLTFLDLGKGKWLGSESLLWLYSCLERELSDETIKTVKLSGVFSQPCGGLLMGSSFFPCRTASTGLTGTGRCSAPSWPTAAAPPSDRCLTPTPSSCTTRTSTPALTPTLRSGATR